MSDFLGSCLATPTAAAQQAFLLPLHGAQAPSGALAILVLVMVNNRCFASSSLSNHAHDCHPSTMRFSSTSKAHVESTADPHGAQHPHHTSEPHGSLNSPCCVSELACFWHLEQGCSTLLLLLDDCCIEEALRCGGDETWGDNFAYGHQGCNAAVADNDKHQKDGCSRLGPVRCVG